MLGDSPYLYTPDGQPLRPTKRARNVSMANVADDGGELGQDANMAGASAMSSMPIRLSPNRVRVEDKTNRKLSCKECRRLKLKCDRIFPCQSCVKRGCGSLCPDGALTSGRGSRFILAGAEQLHDKICDLTERVRQLEEALEIAHAKFSTEPHPLLVSELLKIKTSQELYGSSSSTLYGLHPPTSASEISAANAREETLRQSVGALSLSSQPTYAESSRPNVSAVYMAERDSSPEVSSDILQLSATFPFPWAVDVSMRKRIRDALPPREEAQRICQQARDNALWQFNLDSSETFLPNLLHYCYTTPIENLSPRRLALLLMHLSIGSLVDLKHSLGSLHGEAYHHLARAAVCEIPLMEEPDFDVLHALFFMIWYHLIFSDNRKAVGYAWNLMGFVAKLAQGLGLHRDKPRLKTIPEEHEKRRAVFWELLNMDCRMALSLGRPASIQLTHVDIKLPTCVGPGLYVPREEIVYHEWKNAFFIKCLTPMLEAMVSIKQPAYATIINLDISVRDFGVPSLLDEHQSNDVNPRFLVMQRGLVTMSREIALLQLHRRYFTEAMNGAEGFDLSHPYAPSVLATYLGASSLISAVEVLFTQQQQLSVRFLHFWFNSFSAAVTLALLISRAPSSSLASYAFQDLEKACRLFRSAAKLLPFCSQALPVMQKLAEKSQRALVSRQSGEHSHMLYPQPQPKLPPCFDHAHPLVSQAFERIEARSLAMTSGYPREGGTTMPISAPPTSEGQARADVDMANDSWLPDIYHFSSVGVSLEERYPMAFPKPTPFIPSSPRVSENQIFNFDHGELDVGLVEQTSYMAWF